MKVDGWALAPENRHMELGAEGGGLKVKIKVENKSCGGPRQPPLAPLAETSKFEKREIDQPVNDWT